MRDELEMNLTPVHHIIVSSWHDRDTRSRSHSIESRKGGGWICQQQKGAVKWQKSPHESSAKAPRIKMAAGCCIQAHTKTGIILLFFLLRPPMFSIASPESSIPAQTASVADSMPRQRQTCQDYLQQFGLAAVGSFFPKTGDLDLPLSFSLHIHILWLGPRDYRRC